MAGLFSNHIVTMIIAIVLGGGFSFVLGPIIIPILHKFKFGQNIREDGPKSHLKKSGTPTIGGLIFIISVTIVMLLMGYKFTDKPMIILYGTLAFGFIGFLDDILKIIHKHNEGLTSLQKFILQIIVSGLFAYYGYRTLGTEVVVFGDFVWNMGWLYIPFVIFYFAAVTNGVNLTDGLDGLATSVTILVLTFFCVLSIRLGLSEVGVFSAALVGALFGFLRFNAYPAKVFMGDTGSLALGGAIASMMLVLKTPFLVIIVGGIYVIEVLSVIIQVTSFKMTGKRVFKMAPIHHHFEQIGWKETKIVTVFAIITMVLCIIGFISI